MNKTVILIAGGILGGAAFRGVSGLFPATANPKLVHGLLAVGAGFGATKVNDDTTTSQLLKGALLGGAIVKSLDLGKTLFENTPTAARLATSTGKMSNFLRSATGLGCSMDDGCGLGAVMLGADGKYYQYDEAGLQGTYIDESGQVYGLNGNGDLQPLDDLGLNAYDEEGLNAYDEEGLNAYDEEGLNAYDEEGLNGFQEEYGLNGLENEYGV